MGHLPEPVELRWHSDRQSERRGSFGKVGNEPWASDLVSAQRRSRPSNPVQAALTADRRCTGAAQELEELERDDGRP
jgi:hypothetical protein